MNVVNEIQRINDLELEKGLTYTSGSWHDKYKDSAWVFVGNLPNNLSEGDVLCILSQYGEIEDIHLVRDKDDGKSKGYGFVKYEDARSCILAVDNFTGSQLLGRTMRVDHVEKYRLPKHVQERDLDKSDIHGNGESDTAKCAVAKAGHAYEGQELASSYNIHSGHDPFAAPKNETNLESCKEKTRDIDKDMTKEQRRRRKDERARKRREKEEYRRNKKDRKGAIRDSFH